MIEDINDALVKDERLQSLLSGKTIEDWFILRRDIKSTQWGWVKQERIQKLLDSKILVYDDETEDYLLVVISIDRYKSKAKVDPSLVIKYLNGDIDNIREVF